MLTDSIADFLTRIRNATRARHHLLVVKSSRMKTAIAQVLAEKGFIESTAEHDNMLTLKFRTDRPALDLRRISKPGQRIYVSYKDLKPVRRGLGIGIVSTSRGVMPSIEAKKQRLGGEYICEVY